MKNVMHTHSSTASLSEDLSYPLADMEFTHRGADMFVLSECGRETMLGSSLSSRVFPSIYFPL